MTDSEADLMARYCDGDAAAFHALYALVAARVLAYLVSLIKDRAAAEDLLQQTFLKIHQSRRAYVRGANPVPWIYTIAHRTCLDEMRRRKRTRTTRGGLEDLGAREPQADVTGVPVEAIDPAAGARRTAAAAAVAALDSLPPNQKEALLLTKLHGQSVAEAAAITGSSPGAIKLRAHRAYVTLRKVLGRDVDDATTATDADAHAEEGAPAR